MLVSDIFIVIAMILSIYFFWVLIRIRIKKEYFRQNILYIIIVSIFVCFIIWGISRNFI